MSDLERYYNALKEIARYQTAAQLRRSADSYGLHESEALEMAYENMRGTAIRAIKGKRRPPQDSGDRT